MLPGHSIDNAKLDQHGNVILKRPVPTTGPATIPDDIAYGSRRCGSCSSPGCSRWCAGCDITDVGKIRTFYCSTDCQVKDRASHKASCKARRSIARAASIVHALFVAFEKATCIKPMVSAAEKNGIVTFVRDAEDLRIWTGETLFCQFPEKVLPRDTPREVADTVLFDQTCGEVYTTARSLLALFLQPFCKSCDVVTAMPKNLAKAIYAYYVPRRTAQAPATHSVLKIAAGDGSSSSETYALDITGAQFGWTEIMHDWDTFAAQRLGPPINCSPLGAVDISETILLTTQPLNSLIGGQYLLRRIVMARFVSELQGLLDWSFDWHASFGSKAVEVLMAKTPSEFRAAKQKYLARAISYPQEIIETTLHAHGIGRMYASNDFIEAVTLSAEEAGRLKKVWLNKGDTRVRKGNRAELEAIWQKRLDG